MGLRLLLRQIPLKKTDLQTTEDERFGKRLEKLKNQRKELGKTRRMLLQKHRKLYKLLS